MHDLGKPVTFLWVLFDKPKSGNLLQKGAWYSKVADEFPYIAQFQDMLHWIDVSYSKTYKRPRLIPEAV
jgi:hypothetical protein